MASNDSIANRATANPMWMWSTSPLPMAGKTTSPTVNTADSRNTRLRATSKRECPPARNNGGAAEGRRQLAATHMDAAADKNAMLNKADVDGSSAYWLTPSLPK